MSDKVLNVGIIGTGGIFHGAHAQAWKDMPDAQVIAMCDPKPEKCAKWAAEYGVAEQHIFTDYRELLKVKGLDAVDICTPNLYHSEIAVAALEAGLHVFCEKPDAVNAAEAKRMLDAANASGKTLMVMRNNRFRPDTRWLKRFIDDGHMGEVYTGRCGWVRRRGIPGKGGWFTTKELSGGGPLIDLGVHMIDLALWLMGNPRPVAISGATYRKFAEGAGPSDSEHAQFGEAKGEGTFDVEDLAIGFIRFDNGASLQVECSWASNIEVEKNFVELRGTKAGASVSEGVMKVFTEQSGALCDLAPIPAKAKGHWSGAHAANIKHFVEVVFGRAKPTNTPTDGLHMIQILSAFYESAETGREVRLD